MIHHIFLLLMWLVILVVYANKVRYQYFKKVWFHESTEKFIWIIGSFFVIGWLISFVMGI